MLIQYLKKQFSAGKKLFALLIDPDKHTPESIENLLVSLINKPGPDLILVGGSLLFNGVSQIITAIKRNTQIPVFLFPGNVQHVSENADGILLLSLISGRNPEFLIGNHVQAAPMIRKAGLEVIPTGYLLINSGVSTSVSYMSNTAPIPYDKTDIAVATAMAGEMLGMQLIYLEAGSGAQMPVSERMITEVKTNIQIPLVVGGGIKTTEQLSKVLDAGADMVVVGTAAETNAAVVSEFASFFVGRNQK
ncbi:MAG: geranylgeranylglyceryl/heptaprenylglyceryl phosphate synthase [Salinivirgaceae bacterium]